jgi:cholinesterase
MRAILAGLCLAILSAVINPAGAHSASRTQNPKPFSNIFVFGGPLEDVGNYASVFGDLPPLFFNNRFSNGPLAVEILAARLGLRVTPSLHRIGPAQGNNFSSVDAFASGNETKDLAGQLDAYFAAHGNRADPRALYYIIIGGNEVIEATLEPDDAISRQIIANAVLAKEAAIRRLVAAGAKTILNPNFINIGITPQIRLAGLSERGARMSRLHNRLFDRMLDRVEQELDFMLIRHDFHQFVNSSLNSAAILRLTNTTDSCLALLPSGQCDFEHFVFFNELFPTAKVHDLWGNALTFSIINRERDRCVRLCRLNSGGTNDCERQCRTGTQAN